MANIDKIREVMVHVTRNPEQFDMDVWGVQQEGNACGTTACIAGWALILNGQARWVGPDADGGYRLRSLEPRYGVIEPPAAEILGITDEQADALFYAQDSEVWSVIQWITDGAVTKREVEAYVAANPTGVQA